MCTIREMRERFQAIDLTAETRRVMIDTHTELENLNREQLSKGLDKEGKEMHPRYTEDPYFKSVESATRYAEWKHRLNPAAPFNVPDLFINGRTHESIWLYVGAYDYDLEALVPWAPDLMAKYNGRHLGLSPDSKDEYRADTLKPAIVIAICDKTGAGYV